MSFDESKVKRDSDGKFGSGGGSSKKPKVISRMLSTDLDQLAKQFKKTSGGKADDVTSGIDSLNKFESVDSFEDLKSLSSKALSKMGDAITELSFQASRYGMTSASEEISEVGEFIALLSHSKGKDSMPSFMEKDLKRSQDKFFGNKKENSDDVFHVEKMKLGQQRYGS